MVPGEGEERDGEANEGDHDFAKEGTENDPPLTARLIPPSLGRALFWGEWKGVAVAAATSASTEKSLTSIVDR